jgi:hypothetical protein
LWSSPGVTAARGSSAGYYGTAARSARDMVIKRPGAAAISGTSHEPTASVRTRRDRSPHRYLDRTGSHGVIKFRTSFYSELFYCSKHLVIAKMLISHIYTDPRKIS